jgi:hypothetical protein
MELVVMRNIPQDSDYAEPLLQWLQEVIKRACAVRRDVRVCLNSIRIDIIKLNTSSLHTMEKWCKLA